jgi:Rha family phage regulatory protein
MAIMRYSELTFWFNPEAVRIGSEIVAKEFGKLHKNVIRDIRNLAQTVKKVQEEEAEIDGLKSEPIKYFIESTYLDERNREKVEYMMTRDGFLLLVMGWGDKKSVGIKMKFLRAFETLLQEWRKAHNRALKAEARMLSMREAADRHKPRNIKYDGPETLSDQIERLAKHVGG